MDDFRLQLVYAYDEVVTLTRMRSVQEFPPLSAWFVRSGSVRVRCGGGKPVAAGAGTWMIPAHLRREQVIAAGTHLISVRFHAWLADGRPVAGMDRTLLFPRRRLEELERSALELVALVREAPAWSQAPRGPLARHVFPGSSEEFLRLRRFDAALARWAALYFETLSAAGWIPPLGDARAAPAGRAAAWMRERGFVGSFCENDAAEAAGVSPGYLRRLFRREYGQAPREYWHGRRLERACALLAAGDTPVKHVAYELGFNTPQHFSQWFAKRAGVAPSEFVRRRTREV